MIWIFIGLLVGNGVLTWLFLRRANPDLLARRMKTPRGTVKWDRWSPYIAMFVLGMILGVALDAPAEMSYWWLLLGAVLFVTSVAISLYSLSANPFFEKTVRIQEGHQVAEDGPYRIVRHPGYVGLILYFLSFPLLLGSWWAFAPTALAVLLIIVRTALEDRTLQERLWGYREYVNRTRYRLIPGVW